MRKLLSDTVHLAGRHFLGLRRQPLWLVVSLIQPLSYLLLLGATFRTITDVPAFGSQSYFGFLAPGIAVMMALMFGPWSGFGVMDDLESGVLDRLLVSDVPRSALILARLAQTSLLVIAQTLLVVMLAWLVGASFSGAAVGVPMLCAVAVVAGAAFGALMCGLALTLRSRITLIALSQFISLPPLFLSTLFMQPELLPDWMGTVATYNPIDWAVVVGREGLQPAPDWSTIAQSAALLVGFAVVSLVFALRAVRHYQRAM